MGAILLHASQRTILLNEDLLNINHDPLHEEGHRLYKISEDLEVWGRNLFNGDVAVILFNKGDDPTQDLVSHCFALSFTDTDATVAKPDLTFCLSSSPSFLCTPPYTLCPCACLGRTSHAPPCCVIHAPLQTVDFSRAFGWPANQPALVRDCWGLVDLGLFKGSFTWKGVTPPHGVRVLRISKQ